jgi:hypothetical protein
VLIVNINFINVIVIHNNIKEDYFYGNPLVFALGLTISLPFCQYLRNFVFTLTRYCVACNPITAFYTTS